MAVCDVCGNSYEQSFEVRTADGKTYNFDSFECAVHQVAPSCQHCGCKVLGHGAQADGLVFCCSHCARASRGAPITDNADHVTA